MSLKGKANALWIGPHGAQRSSGEVIYDRKITPLLEAAVNVTFYLPTHVGQMQKILRLLRGQALHWAASHTRQSLREAIDEAKPADVVVCSWEKYDGFSEILDRPVILILHNIASDALSEVFPRNPLMQFVRWRTLAHEKRVYGRPNVKAILVLSLRDKRLVENMGVSAPVLWTPPGTPPAVPLARDATFSPVLAFSGSYDWFPKRRDLRRFLQDLKTLGLALESDEIDQDARSGVAIKPARFDDHDYCSKTLRIGVIPDRFLAGHKLKAGFYICHNAIVVSYADIREEFEGLPHSEDFIRFVTGPEDLKATIEDFSSRDPLALCAAFSEFRDACVERFSWQAIGKVLRDQVLAAAYGDQSPGRGNI